MSITPRKPKFGATYQFPIVPQRDFRQEHQETGLKLSTEPMMRRYSEADLYEASDNDDFNLDILNDDRTDVFNVSAFYNSVTEKLVVTTPEETDNNPAQAAILVKKILEEAGLTLEVIQGVTQSILTGGSMEASQKVSSDTPSATQAAEFSPPDIPDFNVISPDEVAVEDMTSMSSGYLRVALRNALDSPHSEKKVLDAVKKNDSFQYISNSDIEDMMEKAARHGFLNLIHELRSRGHNKGLIEETAAIHGQTSVIEYLLQQGHTLSEEDMNGNNLFKLAVSAGETEMLQYLVSKGVSPAEASEYQEHDRDSLIADTIRNSDLNTLKLLHESYHLPLKLNHTDESQSGLLPLAAVWGDLEIFKYLYEKLKYNIVATETEKNPAHKAAEAGDLNILEFLNKEDKRLFYTSDIQTGKNGLLIAAEWHKGDIVARFVKDQGDCLTYDNNRNSAAHYLVTGAFKGGNEETKTACRKALKRIYTLSRQSFKKRNHQGKTVWESVPKMWGKENALKKAMSTV